MQVISSFKNIIKVLYWQVNDAVLSSVVILFEVIILVFSSVVILFEVILLVLSSVVISVEVIKLSLIFVVASIFVLTHLRTLLQNYDLCFFCWTIKIKTKKSKQTWWLANKTQIRITYIQLSSFLQKLKPKKLNE